MATTQVSAEFAAFGDAFPIEEVTKRLGVCPSGYYQKGDMIPDRNHMFRPETSWYITEGYQASMDISDQLDPLVDQLEGKVEELRLIREQYNVSYKIYVVMKVENGRAPAMYLDSRVIEFLHNIKAELDVDIYA